MTMTVAAEVVTRVTKIGVNRLNVVTTERGCEITVRSDATKNVGGGRRVHSAIPPLNNFQIHMPRACGNNSNETTPSVSEVMQFLLMRAETDAQQ